MKKGSFFIIFFLFLAAATIVLGLMFTYDFSSASAEDTAEVPTPAPTLLNAQTTPTPKPGDVIRVAEANTLVIPSLNIRAPIEKVGITKTGKMAVTRGYSNVGLYKFGVAPGQKGNAVIGGHVDNALGLPAVFNDLNKLKKGDNVFVADEHGNMLRFVVTKTQIYDVTQAPVDSIFGPSTTAHLNLITCDGTWIQSQKSYDKRLVVFTDLAM